jgi:putative aldouronate transport system substrate-binding protein
MEELEAYLDVVTANEDIRAINNVIQATMWDNALFPMACKYNLEREFGQGNFDLTYDLSEEKITIVPMERTEAFREASAIRERWYQKGWIPQNAMNDTETVALLNDGKYAASIRGVQDAAGGITSGPGEAKTYVMYPDSLASIGGTLGNMVCFNRNAKNPERTMMFLEWMNASQENYSAVMYGIEGTTYVIEDGVLNYPAGQDAGTSYLNWGGAWGFVRNQWRLPAFDYTPELKAAKAADLAMPTNVRSTLAGFTFDTEPVSTEIANRQAVTDQYGKMLQYGLRSDVDAAIQEYVAKADEAGTDKIVAELQRQIDEFLANK